MQVTEPGVKTRIIGRVASPDGRAPPCGECLRLQISPEPFMRLMMSLFAVLLLCCATSAQALADKRVALVIGNSNYRAAPRIDTAVNDATAMAELFRKAGFDFVDLKSDLGLLQFRSAIADFRKAAEGSDIAVVYYAGHGLEVDRENYLIPVDAALLNIQDTNSELVSLQAMVSATAGASKLHLIVLDACRDIASGVRIRRENGLGSRVPSAGLARVEPAAVDTLIAYASGASTTSVDQGVDHSPFTAALLKSLTVPGLDIRLAFARVRDDVRKATDGRQEPFVYGSMSGGIISLAQAAAGPSTSDADQKSDFELVDKINTRRAWLVFLRTYKTGFYADLARARLKAVVEDPGGALVPPPPDPPAGTR
jgi:hypothetical protein